MKKSCTIFSSKFDFESFSGIEEYWDVFLLVAKDYAKTSPATVICGARLCIVLCNRLSLMLSHQQICGRCSMNGSIWGVQ